MNHTLIETVDFPDFISLFIQGENNPYISSESSFVYRDIGFECKKSQGKLKILLLAENSPVKYIRLRWNRQMPQNAVFLGDAWERLYGDAQWRSMDASRLMPWYFFMQSEEKFEGFGVCVRPAAFALWMADSCGVTLILDVRCANAGVVLNGRQLNVATIVHCDVSAGTPFESAVDFCRIMCQDPLLPPMPVYGSNNWYYAYGYSSSEDILEDSRYLARLTQGLDNRPFMVIDDGWELHHDDLGQCGPWTRGNTRFPNMGKLAAKMKKIGVRPAVWFRPLCDKDEAVREEWHLPHSNQEYLDPSVPDVLEWVKADMRCFHEWGFELVKHDFTTVDIFGHYAFDMHYFPAEGDWSFADSSKTSAEIVIGLYRAILEGAENMLILGCNTIGHLSAGLMHISRIGDDTSGLRWDRTRKMGINALAFRLCQHRTFFDVDADCVGFLGTIPWRLNHQWSSLASASGTSYFASIKPGALSQAEEEEIKKHFAMGSRQVGTAVPLDWMTNATPEHWNINGKNVDFSWFEEEGPLLDFM